MANSNKEIGAKAHKFRKAFLISSIAAGALSIAMGAFVFLSSSPIVLIANASLLAVALGGAVASGVAVNKIYDSSKIKINKSKAGKALQKIKQLNNDVSTTYSQKYRSKVLKKYAKANLVLTRRLGATIFGEFHSTSGIANQQATELINQIDAYNILQSTATRPRAQKKYSKKVTLLETKLAKIVQEEGDKCPKCKWTKTYDQVLNGAAALDRRTEISCLTTVGRDLFQNLFENANYVTDASCVNVYMRYSENANLAPAVARAEDQTKAMDIKKILLTDLYEACKTKTSLEIKSMFPITVESKIVNKNTTKVEKIDVLTVANYSELQQLMGINHGRQI